MVLIENVKNESQIECLAGLARIIWHEHYDAILSREQVDYMLKRFLCVEAVHNQIKDLGYHYYLVACEGREFGFMGIQPKKDKLYLSKLYILKDYRGKGYAGKLFDFAIDFAKRADLKSIYLTVNRNNYDSIEIYKKRDFQIIRTEVADIGGGYVMDDYIMEKNLT